MDASPTPDATHLREAIALAAEALDDDDGGPFGAVLVREGRVLARGRNRVLADADPTAHAEIVVIRAAARALGTHDLAGCTVYASCEPCPMCRAALRWARVDRVVYAATRQDAAAAGFDDERFHAELTGHAAGPVPQAAPALRAEAAAVMGRWAARPDRRLY